MEQYCPTCKRTTTHTLALNRLVLSCSVCTTSIDLVSQSQAQQIGEQRPFIAPDGTKASIVALTPKQITFYIAKGQHKGYYIYDRINRTYEIKQA